jgi:hypothetical protein
MEEAIKGVKKELNVAMNNTILLVTASLIRSCPALRFIPTQIRAVRSDSFAHWLL